MHLHAIVEFGKPVDWTGLRAVAFNGVRPNAQPTSGRGTKVNSKELNTHGHFYVFANKAIRMALK